MNSIYKKLIDTLQRPRTEKAEDKSTRHQKEREATSLREGQTRRCLNA